jgi:peptide/nickel transport system permease protein
MLNFILRRLGVMALTMLCLTLVVFYLVNLEPNLRRLALSQIDMRSTEAHIESWLTRMGYREPFLVRYGQWIGVVPKQPAVDEEGNPVSRFRYCPEPAETT